MALRGARTHPAGFDQVSRSESHAGLTGDSKRFDEKLENMKEILIRGDIRGNSQVEVVIPTRTGTVIGVEISRCNDGTAESAKVQIDYGDGDIEWLPIDRDRVCVDKFWG